MQSILDTLHPILKVTWADYRSLPYGYLLRGFSQCLQILPSFTQLFALLKTQVAKKKKKKWEKKKETNKNMTCKALQ